MTNTQTQKFMENWTKNHKHFGEKTWNQEPDFCYYIEFPIPLETSLDLLAKAEPFFEKINLNGGFRLAPSELHLTITLPGRLGTHFQKNDVNFIKKTLENTTKSAEIIPLEIKNFNCFPEVIFAEIHDPSHRLQQLHETLCNEIPFSQHPEFRYTKYLPHISLVYGGTTDQPIPLDLNRSFDPINLNLDQLTLGKAKWENQTLKKPIIAQYQL